VIERHFGESPPYSLGVEEELMILDAETLEPAAAVDVLVSGAKELDLPGRLKTELHASIVELNTDVCGDVDEAVAALRQLRRGAEQIAAEHGLAIAASGTHPTAPLESLPVVQEARYLELVNGVGRAMRRQGVSGLHVHVGVESAQQCYERLEAVLPWLPVVLAVSVNSPFLAGVETGMLSNRAAILAELPRAGAPPAFGSFEAWEAWVERLVDLGVLEDKTRIWWDVRPNPILGTVEIRAPDQPTALERTALLVRLLRELVEHAEPRVADRGHYQHNRWAAARCGLGAKLIHPDGDRVATARELARELLGEEPPEPEACAQLAADDVTADLVARTVA
jgi:glutamate---cysteine ligase / carboxylate-amine ligase